MEIQWSLVLFTALAGAGSVLFACVGFSEFKGRAKNDKSIVFACVAAIALLVAGGLCSVGHLSHADRILAVLAHPAPGIFLEALLIGIDALLAILYLVLVRREAGKGARQALAALGILMGVVFPFSCGASYMMDSQLAWNTITLPLGYLGTALPAGIAAWALICAVNDEGEELRRLSGLELAAGSACALILACAYGIVSGAAAGDQALLFWGGVIVIGCLAPLAAGVLLRSKPESAVVLSAAGLACGLLGSVCFRVLMWTGSVALMSLFGVAV